MAARGNRRASGRGVHPGLPIGTPARGEPAAKPGLDKRRLVPKRACEWCGRLSSAFWYHGQDGDDPACSFDCQWMIKEWREVTHSLKTDWEQEALKKAKVAFAGKLQELNRLAVFDGWTFDEIENLLAATIEAYQGAMYRLPWDQGIPF